MLHLDHAALYQRARWRMIVASALATFSTLFLMRFPRDLALGPQLRIASTFRFINVLINVDFPTFGIPAINARTA